MGNEKEAFQERTQQEPSVRVKMSLVSSWTWRQLNLVGFYRGIGRQGWRVWEGQGTQDYE
jgi:hypothetical protein